MSLLIIIIGFLITVLSIDVMRLMDGGDKPCRVVKFVMSAVVGVMLIYYAVMSTAVNPVGLIHLFCAVTLLLFIWPEIFFRVMEQIRRSHPILYAKYLYHIDHNHRRSDEHANS
jgi:hypothetical protein